tara:strand:- start:4445 stop:5179 length:735 start_codon:yes stop_codon:yes gene_type:complete
MKSLDGKAAIVTGASSGIGRAIARALGDAGVSLTLTARRADRLEAIAGEMESAQAVQADFRDEEQIRAAIKSAAHHWGRLDILINSAGLAKQAKLTDGDSEDWREMLDVNVLGLAIANREALRYFDPQAGGQIVNICSMSGHRVPGKGGFYAATKFAVRAMSEGLRQELRAAGNSTRVSQVSPGFVDTELLDIYFQTSGADRYSAVDYEMLKPDDIARTVLHVLTAPDHVDVTDVLVRPRAQVT